MVTRGFYILYFHMYFENGFLLCEGQRQILVCFLCIYNWMEFQKQTVTINIRATAQGFVNI